MARTEDKHTAIALRKRGMSYSQIKDELGVSKSTLSVWLKDMPLSESRVRALRANSERRIEKYRATMARKKSERREEVFLSVRDEILKSKDPEFVSGFYLYWGEGTKTAEYSVSFTNSDPAMVKCFILWLCKLGIKRQQMKVKLHVYRDQQEPTMRQFWSRILQIPLENFNKSYVKSSRLEDKNYKGMFSYGTCVVSYHDRDMHEYVMAGVRFLREKYKIAE